MLILAQMLIGLGFSVFYINAIKLISNWFPPKMQATAIGVLSAALGMGSFAAYIGFPLSSNLAGGWRTLYLYCCALLMVNLIANFFILRDNPSSKTELKANSIGPALVDVFRDLRLYPLLVGYILAGFGWVFASWIPQFLTDARGFSYIEAGLVSSAGTLAGIPGCILIGAISDRLRRRKLPLVVFSSSYTCLLALFLSLPQQAPLTLFLIVNAACGFTVSLWVLLFSMVPETLPPDKAGIGLGVLNSVGTLGFTLLAPIYGALVDASGGYLPSNAIILIGGVLMTIVFAIFTRETYRGVEET
jgi:sugar phosphate permease